MSRRVFRLARRSLPLLAALVGCAKGESAPAAVATAVREVPERWSSVAWPDDDLDSPAIWWDAIAGRAEVLVTAKQGDRLHRLALETGEQLGIVGGPGSVAGAFDRPNGIAVLDSLLVVVERDNRRVQVFALPAFRPLVSFGADVLRRPYGVWMSRVDPGSIRLFVTDSYDAGDEENRDTLAMGRRVVVFDLQHDGAGWGARVVRVFGDTVGRGVLHVVESLWGDPARGVVLIADEDTARGMNAKVYGLDGRFTGRTIGDGIFRHQVEGIALDARADGTGLWVVSDQSKSRTTFHVFDRVSGAHRGSFRGRRTANTDGIWLETAPRPGFPRGVLLAVDDDAAVAAFDWGMVLQALKFP